LNKNFIKLNLIEFKSIFRRFYDFIKMNKIRENRMIKNINECGKQIHPIENFIPVK